MKACSEAGIHHTSYYIWLRKDKNYAEAFEAAKQIAADNFEDEIYRCGFEGYDKPVTYQGEIKGHSLIARTIVTAFLLTAMNGASLFSIGSGNGIPAKGNLFQTLVRLTSRRCSDIAPVRKRVFKFPSRS